MIDLSAVRDALDTQGFAIVRGFLAPDEVEALRAAFDRLLATARTLEGPSDVGSARFVVDAEPFRLRRVVWAGGADPTIARLGPDPRYVELAAGVLESHAVDQLIQQAHFKLPGDGVDFAFHQDASNRRYGSDLWSDVDGRGSYLQTALAVDPMSSRNGALQAVPGSHRLGFVADPLTGALPEGLLDDAPIVDLELDPGDLVAFGPFLVHGSPPNHGTRPRRLFLQGYAQPGVNRRVYPGAGTGVRRTRSER